MTGIFLPQALIVPFVGVLGLIAGSFLNVVIHRGPRLWKLSDDESRQGDLAAPRSYCPACRAPIRNEHLIPLASYFMLQGKCASCAAPISARYPVVEALGAIAALVCYFAFGPSWSAFAGACFLWALIALSVIDLETGFLPDALTLPAIAAGLLVNINGMFAPITAAAIGAVAGYLSFWAIAEAFKRLRGVEGLGRGDAKLLAALGAWLGWQMLAPIVFIAAVTALVAVGFMLLFGRRIGRNTELAFGPALAAAGAAALIAEAYYPIVP